ncbi:MAG: sugar phosphate isomerase/epimerase [Verrucomicrobiae bacterium]|nr:sugar phosphate isomerase/epimerase [Verrucomicrobiae bacterium]MCP5539008.1 sugar phosphate isomerase/epimerase [Akkermansiaceae bacterium]MCP5550605.1 sugar phosphate isomerase/epimerase [Akkermansiaceae bacterium]
MHRRHFLRNVTGAAAAALGTEAVVAPASLRAGKADPRYTFCTFTKPIQHFSFEETAKTIAKLGFDGVEAPVRPGGQVVPETVEDDLPKFIAALRAEGLEMTVLTSGINEVSAEQRTEAVLRTAAGLGVKRFRMLYYKYDLARPIRSQLDEFRPRLRDLVAFCKEIGIKPIYQNHSGRDYFGAPVWDLAEVMGEFDPADAGVAFDIGHATIEGSKCWPLHWALIRDHIDTVYIKEPRWGDDQKPKVAPLGTGGVDKGFYKTLLKSGFTGPVSLHVEYFDHKDPSKAGEAVESIGSDFATLKSYLEIG